MEKTELSINVFHEAIEKFKNEYADIWRDAGDSFPCFDITFARGEQSAKEKDLDKRVKRITKEFRAASPTEERKMIWSNNIKWATRDIAGSAFGFKNDEISSRVIDEFSQTAKDFIKDARLFNPDIDLTDINQAIRNLWIANSIQVMLDNKIGLSPSIFAYSMLYPYTDNFLDDPLVTEKEKKEINIRFKKRLEGGQISPENEYESSLFRLVEMIESEYSRETCPKVYDSLMGIHKAQEKSLRQHTGCNMSCEEDILGISFEKGGTSVLADAFLVNPGLNWKVAGFMFGFGVFLQLIDDVEDSFEDLKNGHMTVFSQAIGSGNLDGITSRLFHFIEKVMDWDDECMPNFGKLKDIVKYNSYFLILEAIAKNSRAYSSRYVMEIEKFSPYSFSYMLKMKKKIKKRYCSFDLKKFEI